MVSIVDVMRRLSEKRPVFHSEADFQHALAWELHLIEPEHARVRLEQRKPLNGAPAHIDLIASVQGQRIAIELKYKTAGFKGDVKGEEYHLRAQGAQDIGACLFWKDVSRLEQLRRAEPPVLAYAIFLTNDQSYWRSSGRVETNADAFRLTDGRTMGRRLQWGTRTSERTKRVHDRPIELSADYRLQWRNYGLGDPCLFRYLLLEVH